MLPRVKVPFISSVGPAWKSVTIGSPFLPTPPVGRWAAITLSILVTFIVYSMESPKFSNHTQPLADELLGGISFSPLRVAKNFCPRALTRKGGIKVVIKAITIPIRITITAIVCSYEFMETKIGLHLIFLRFALCQATLYNSH